MSKSLRSISDPVEKKRAIARRLKNYKAGQSGLGTLAAVDAKNKLSKKLEEKSETTTKNESKVPE
jgi:hypothetical protein